ncbi:hypothetical protein LCGC14_0714810 [marine sediment metagenome]|uniref:LamG-like jellyroll fold domain-containing protein n=1 Tax=marine sediment metagenome TaxID=412755 RepID=A0A0F9SZK6_9ZZZZ
MRRHILLYLLTIVIISILSSFTSALLVDSDLIHVYNFTNTTSVNLTDQVGTDNSLDGEITDLNVAGIFRNAWHFEFDNDDWVTMPPIIDNLDDITITAWFKPEALAGTRETIWSSGDDASGSDANWVWWIEATNTMNFRFTTDAFLERTCNVNLPAKPLGTWMLLSISYNGAVIKGFINDTLVCSTTATGLIKADSNFTIGAKHTHLDTGDGDIDEVYVWNDNLSLEQIGELWNGGVGDFYPFGGVSSTATPTIVAPSPADNSNNNTNVTLNVSHTTTQNDVRYYLYFAESTPLDEGDFYIFNETRTGVEYKSFLTNVSDGTFFWKWKVQNITDGVFSGNTTERTLIIDTVTPTITIHPNNAFNTSNLSSQNQYLDFMFLNISVQDETALFGFLVNITTGGVSFFNHTNTSLSSILSHNFTANISTALWPDGVFDIEISASDSHTLSLIKDYDISKFLSRITFETTEGNTIDIIGSGATSTDYFKKKDRYGFSFNYLFADTERTFTIKSDKKIYYLNNSNYKAHFVIWNQGKKSGNWIDLEGIGGDYSVVKKKDNEYEVSFTNLPSGKSIDFNSLGGLNVITQNFQWFKGSTNNIFNSAATSGFRQEFLMNITLDFDLVKMINASFTYNNTARAVTRTESASSILFNSTFIVPDVNQTLNLSWFFNVTQRNDAVYSFSVNATQELVSPQINLTILDEENQSLITEDLTIFFTGPINLQTNTSSGTLSIGNLVLGEYFIQAESTNYPRRGLFFTITNASANVNLYLVREVTGNSFIDYIVQDDGRNRLNNVRMTFQRNINNSFVTVAQLETDFAGQGRIFQDQQNEYRIVMSLTGFETQTIDLLPLLTSYTITLSTLAEQIFQTTYEGIRYTISPAARVLNASGKFRDISLTIFDGTSSLEFFGLQITNHSYTCIPADCITNITGSPAGGTAVVQINLSEEGSFTRSYFFKRNGFPLQFINVEKTSVRFLIGDRLEENFRIIGANLGTPVMRAIFAAILITVFAVLASQIGVIGLGLMLVISFGTIFFMLLGFIPRMIGMITLFFGIAIYFVLGKEQ